MKAAPAPRLDELDDPAEGSSNGLERVTMPPPFEPMAFAQEVEDAAGRATLPPGPAFEMLRDSCKLAALDPVEASLDPADAQSHVKIKTRT